MKDLTMKLKEDFYQQIRSSQTKQTDLSPNSQPSLPLLTEEELALIEKLWVELILWKKKHSH